MLLQLQFGFCQTRNVSPHVTDAASGPPNGAAATASAVQRDGVPTLQHSHIKKLVAPLPLLPVPWVLI